MRSNAHVSLPMVSDTVFMLSSDKSDELVSSLDGSNPEDESASSSLVKTMIGQYKSALEKERVVFFLMLGLYGLVILFGLLAIFWHGIISPELRKKRTLKASSMKEFYLEKSEQPIRQHSSAHFTTQGAAKVRNVGSRVGSMVASPLARLRQKRSRRREVHSALSFSAVHPKNAVNVHGDNRAISPPPVYPPRSSTHWTQHPSTLSLLGALNLPDQTKSRQSLASVQPSSAGVSPNRSSHADALHKSSEQLYNKPQEAPSLSVPYLYGTLPAPGVPSPARPPRPATSLNPFVTPFDAPNGQ